MREKEGQADLGLIGLAVMGQNLALNAAEKGFRVAVFNRTVEKVDDFLKIHGKAFPLEGAHSIEELVALLKRPRRLLLMVKAGEAVDQFIAQLEPHLEAGDIIIDGGNSLFTDTTRRCRTLKEKGIAFIGCGISGGEEGARHGPSIMPGGNPDGWPAVRPLLQAIAAKVDGEPCCDWVGEEGAGHYVKMVHNGIEYGDMQLISETYQLLRQGLGLNCDELAKLFTKWNQGVLDSYLIEITSHILAHKEESGLPLLDKILDVAGQKGTGRWTAYEGLNESVPLTLIAEAVFARFLSSSKEERLRASQLLQGPQGKIESSDRTKAIEQVRQALYGSKIISYAQGFMLMKSAAAHYGWRLNYGAIALMWRGGCIIRSAFLGKIKEAFSRHPSLENLLFDDYFQKQLAASQAGWRQAISAAVLAGIPTACMSAALAFYDGYRTAQLPANLLQAQRDYFGAHTYERVDQPRGKFFHTDWIGSGGDAQSGSYSA